MVEKATTPDYALSRNFFNGYKVVYVPFENGRPAGKAQAVVTGFIDGTGALLVADDAGNTVWRVAAADGSVSPRPVATDDIGRPQAGGAAAAPALRQADVSNPAAQTEIAPAP